MSERTHQDACARTCSVLLGVRLIDATTVIIGHALIPELVAMLAVGEPLVGLALVLDPPPSVRTVVRIPHRVRKGLKPMDPPRQDVPPSQQPVLHALVLARDGGHSS